VVIFFKNFFKVVKLIGEVVDSSTTKMGNRSQYQIKVEKFSKSWFSAMRKGNTKKVQQIISKLHADELETFLHKKTRLGHTALMVASKYGRTEIVSLLIDAVDNFDNEYTNIEYVLNEVDNFGRTALMWAAQFGHDVTAETLLSGLDKNKTRALLSRLNYSGKNALSIAKKHGQEKMVEFLTICFNETQVPQVLQIPEDEPYFFSIPLSPLPALSPLSAVPPVKFEWPVVTQPVIFRNPSPSPKVIQEKAPAVIEFQGVLIRDFMKIGING
jgi:hypothetical protein